MSTVEELIEKQQELDAPPPPPLTDFQKRLAAAREAQQECWEVLDVVLGDEILHVEIGQIPGGVWCDIAHHHPAEVRADVDLGYNRETLPRDYPADRIKLAGEPTTTDTWQAVYDLLDAEDRKSVQAVIWWLNIGEPEELHRQLSARRAVALDTP